MADAIHGFGLGMKRPVPAQRIGSAEWKVEIGEGVQDFRREALFPKCSFSRNVGKWAERVMKMDCYLLAGAKRTLLQSRRMQWSLPTS